MSDLTEFLLARIAEDEEVARRAIEDNDAERVRLGWSPVGPTGDWRLFNDYGSVCVDTTRVLAEREARWRIVELCDTYYGDDLIADKVLRLLALPYADHPDYQQEWKP